MNFSDCDVGIVGLFFAVWIIILLDVCHFGLINASCLLIIMASVGEFSEFVEAKIFHLEAPFDAVEGIVSQGW